MTPLTILNAIVRGVIFLALPEYGCYLDTAAPTADWNVIVRTAWKTFAMLGIN